MNKSKILYNKKCSICNYEIEHYKKRSNLDYVDCSNMDDKYLKKLHVKFEDGSELSGVEAFIFVWERTDGYHWLAKLVSMPLIINIAKFCYSIIAFLLFWRFKIFAK
tara:strand:- start:1096 stop:1416 length:321 start_codon:yes stop_codon:yes gene_type:complete